MTFTLYATIILFEHWERLVTPGKTGRFGIVYVYVYVYVSVYKGPIKG